MKARRTALRVLAAAFQMVMFLLALVCLRCLESEDMEHLREDCLPCGPAALSLALDVKGLWVPPVSLLWTSLSGIMVLGLVLALTPCCF